MPFTSRALIAAAYVMLLAVAGCSGSLTAPSDSGATIAGTVNPGTASASTNALSSGGLTGATAPSGWTVTIVGTNLTVALDASGNFQISGVPSGDVQLLFTNGVTSGTITLSSVAEGDLIRITVIISGSTVTLVNETRTSGKVDLCHRTEYRGAYHLINVSVNAEPAHRAHGDGAIGERVQADPTKVFSPTCTPVPFGVSIEKSTNDQDADQAPGPAITVGSLVIWRYVVTNTSTVNLTNVSVTDDRGVVVNCGGKTTLAMNESMTCTASGVAVAGQYTNVGMVTANSTLGPFTHSDPSHYFGVTPTSSNESKVQLCHRTGNGSYHLIEVGVTAEPAHRAHGDARPGEAVPGQPGRVFSPSCAVL